jgi:hypothetical protein
LYWEVTVWLVLFIENVAALALGSRESWLSVSRFP